MKLVVPSRIAAVAVATLLVACFWAVPANAGICKGSKAHCHTTKKATKHATHARHADHRYAYAKPRARCRCHRETGHNWQGWVVTRRGPALYLDGVRYAGGNPHGPAAWYNNYEGGFNAAVFWKLSERNLP